MVTKIKYQEIKQLNPPALAAYIQDIEKSMVKEVKVRDLIHEGALDNSFASTYHWDLYPRGVYMFFDKDDCIRYVGQSNVGFYQRLWSQFDETPTGLFGTNILLIKMGCERTGKERDALEEVDHIADLEIVRNEYRLVLIEATHDELDKDKLVWLEKYIMKAFRNRPRQKLLNTRIGWLNDHENITSIENLMNQ